MPEGLLRKTLSAVTASASSLKPSSSTPSQLIRSHSVPSTNLSDSSDTTVDMLSLQALHYQSMGFDLNLESTLDREQEPKTSDVRCVSAGPLKNAVTIQTISSSGTQLANHQSSGKQELSGENETLQGVLNIIESAVYPHCGHDTSSISSRSISSEHGDSKQDDKAITSELQDRQCSSVMDNPFERTTLLLCQYTSTTCTMPKDVTDNPSERTQEQVESHTTGKEAEKESIVMINRDDLPLDSQSLLSQYNERHIIRKQDHGALESQTTVQASEHPSLSPRQSPALHTTASTHTSGIQANEQVQGKQENAIIAGAEAKEMDASLPQGKQASGSSQAQKDGRQCSLFSLRSSDRLSDLRSSSTSSS